MSPVAGITHADAQKLIAAMGRPKVDAAPFVGDLARWLGWSPDRLSDAVDAAELAGLVEPWGFNRITLSPLSANRLGLHLVARLDRGIGVYFWDGRVRRKTRRRQAHPDGKVTLECDLADDSDARPLEQIVDPVGDGVGELIDAVEAARRGRPSADHLGRIAARGAHFVGLGRPWQEWEPGAECPECRGRELTALELCSRCQRSGLDDLIGYGQPLAPDRPTRAYVRGRTAEEAKAARAETRRQRRAQQRHAVAC